MIKYLPIPFAVIMATIILKVKRIEAEFALTEYGTEVMSTSSVLFTANGSPVDPETMASILSQTFDEFGLPINLQDLRHALEAFAHKFSPEGSNSSSIYAELANHNPGTSYRYGRDQDCFAGIPADISMANSSACNNWNSFILDSPSLMSSASRPKILQQLQNLQLMHPSDTTAYAEEDRSLLNGDDFLSQSSETSSALDKVQRNQYHLSEQYAEHISDPNVDGAVRTWQSDKSHEENLEAAGVPSQISTAVCHMSPPPTQMKKRLRNPQEIQERKLLAQTKLRLFEGMRPKQKQALQFLESTSSSAFIILPTGSGKTHLIWSHKRDQECAVIFVPYRLLASQLQCVLESHGLTVTWPFLSYSGSIHAMLCNVQFAILPYEAAPEAAGLIASLNEIGRLGPIWIDEVCVLQNQSSSFGKYLLSLSPGSHTRFQRKIPTRV